MADANRDAAAFSPPAATRGRLSEEDWHDVRRAARIAREEGVWLCVHRGKVWAAPFVRKPCKNACKQHKKPTPSMAGQEKKKGRRQLRRSGQEGHGHPSKPPGMVQKGSKKSAAP